MTSPLVRATLEIARKEVRQHVRTKRLLVMAAFFLLALVVITIVLPVAVLDLADAASEVGIVDVALENAVLLFFMSGILFLSGAFYVQLLPIVITADAVCSEWQSRTVFLLLSKPVSRTAFVLGKFVGSFATVAALVVGLLTLDYVVLQPLLPGAPTAGEVGNFFAFLGLVVLGVASFTAFALLLSTFTRSTVASTVAAVASWIIAFPILARIDMLIAAMRFGERAFAMTPEAAGIGWSQYLTPSASMDAAQAALARDVGGLGMLEIFAGAGIDVGWAAFAVIVQTALFLGLAVWIVRRRDFE